MSYQRDKYGLTGNQRKFADSYRGLSPRNGTTSYMEHYSCKSVQVATAAASRLLAHVKVAGYIELMDEEASKSLQITAKDVIRVDKLLHSSDIRNIFDESGIMLHPNDLPDCIAECVSECTVVERTDPQGNTTTSYKYKFWDKGSAQNRLYKHLNMYEVPEEKNKEKIDVELVLMALKIKHG